MDNQEKQVMFDTRHRTKTSKTKITTQTTKAMSNTDPSKNINMSLVLDFERQLPIVAIEHLNIRAYCC